MSRQSTGSLCPYRDKKNWGRERRTGDMMRYDHSRNEAGLHEPLYWLKGSSTLWVMLCTTCIYVPWVCLCRRSWRCSPTETQPAVGGQGRTSHTERLPPAAECVCVSPSASCITHTHTHTETVNFYINKNKVHFILEQIICTTVENVACIRKKVEQIQSKSSIITIIGSLTRL